MSSINPSFVHDSFVSPRQGLQIPNICSEIVFLQINIDFFLPPKASKPCFFSVRPHTEQAKDMTSTCFCLLIWRDFHSPLTEWAVSSSSASVYVHAKVEACARASRDVEPVFSSYFSQNDYFRLHSSSVSSKAAASAAMWMELGSPLPIQPIGVRLKEGRQPTSCWNTTAGSGSGWAASASGSWNFMNCLAFSKPP